MILFKMRNNVLIILSILVLVVGQISEETASQRTQLTLSFGQTNELDPDENYFIFYGFTTKSIDTDFQISFLIKLIKNIEPTENSETVESICTTQGGINPSDKASATIQFACQIQGDYDSIEIVSSDNIAGIPSDPNLLNPVITSIFIDTDSLIYPETPAPQLVEQPIIDYTKAGNGLLEFTINLRQADGNIKEGQSFKIKLLYPNGIILKFTITEINELTIKLDCEIDGEVIDQRLYVEQTAIVADGKYLFILPGFKTEIITVNETIIISEGTASQRTQLTLSFGQTIGLDTTANTFIFFGFTTKSFDPYFQFTFLVKLIKEGTEDSETVESTCSNESGDYPNDKGITSIIFICKIQGDYDSIEIVSSDAIAGILLTQIF